MTVSLVTVSGTLSLGDPPDTDLVCGRCAQPAQLVIEGRGGRLNICAGCVEYLAAEWSTRTAPTTTDSHWLQASRDYGWPGTETFEVHLWAPHGRDVPAAWLDRFLAT